MCSSSRPWSGSDLTVNVRSIDATQYENRLRSWDSTSSWRRGGNRCRRATSSASSGARRRRAAPLAQPVGIADPGDRQADRPRDLRHRPRRPRRRHQGARPASSCGITSWCHNGPTARFRTARWDRLGRPDPSRNTAWPPSRTSGGSTRRGPTRSAGVLERSDAASRSRSRRRDGPAAARPASALDGRRRRRRSGMSAFGD